MTPREKNVAYFLSGMGIMALLFVLLERPSKVETVNEQCGQSIAVAQALQEFLEAQHGVRFHSTGHEDFSALYSRPIMIEADLKEPEIGGSGWPSTHREAGEAR